jgi:hypothetical protein
MNILTSLGSLFNYKFTNTTKELVTEYATYYGVKLIRGINYSGGVIKNIVEYSKKYFTGDEYDKSILDVVDKSALEDISPEELSQFKYMDSTSKFKIVYKFLNNIMPHDKKIKINTDAKKQISKDLNDYTIDTDYNLKGYLVKNRDKPLDNFTRILLPLKFSNLSWYVNNQLINNKDYTFILDLFTIFDAFIIIENHDRFFYNYIQKIKLTGLTTIDIEFILSLLWSILDTDVNVKDKYEYIHTKSNKTKFKLIELNNIFNIIFHLEHAKLLGIDKVLKVLKSLGLGVIESFETDFKEFLLSHLSEPYLSECKKNIHTLTFGQFIANYILSFKDNTPGLSMLYLGSFQRLLDEVISPSGKNNTPQTGGVGVISSISTAIFFTNINKALNIIFSNGIYILANIDTYSQHYLSFLYTKNITYNELKDKILNSKYTDSLLYIIESPDNPYPYLKSLILTIQFTPVLTVKQRSMFINKPDDSENRQLNYTKPTTNFTPFTKAFKDMQFSMTDEINKTFNIMFILNILATSVGSIGPLAKTYILIKEKLKLSNNIVVHEYIKLFNSKENIFDSPSRLILNIFNNIQNDKTLSIYLRQVILYQIIYTNTYLLIAEYLSISNRIENKATGRRNLTESNYNDIRNIAEKIAQLLYKKDIKAVNIIVNAYLYRNNYLFPGNEHLSKLFKKAIDFNMERNSLIELNKIYLSDKINLLQNLLPKHDTPKYDTLNIESTYFTESNTSNNESFHSAKSNTSNNESYHSAKSNTIEEINTKKNKLVKRNTLLNFYKFIFQYNLAITSYDIEASLGYNIIDGLFICDETKDILDFYKMDPTKYDLYMPVDLTERVNFLEY